VLKEAISNSDEVKFYSPRFRYLYTLVALFWLTIASRLWYLQIMQGSQLREFSEKNHIREIKFEAPRGLFLDRENRTLVNNRLGFEVYIQSQYVRDRKELVDELAKIINIPADQIELKFKKKQKQQGRFASVKIKENLSLEETFQLKRLSQILPGIEIREKVVREYELGPNGSQLFGYVGEISKSQLELMQRIAPEKQYESGDTVGKFGLEELLEQHLHGENGLRLSQVDAFGREIRNQDGNNETIKTFLSGDFKNRPPKAGKNAMLTIDLDIQKAAWEAFTSENKFGSAVVLNRDGEILAWVSVPGFDPNAFIGGVDPELWKKLVLDPRKPLRNKLIQDHYPPGSTFKPLVALAALEKGVVRAQTVIACPGFIMFGNKAFHDHKREGFGALNIIEALERSSNVFFYKMGIALGVDNMYKYISQFGIGSKTGIEIPREAPGLMPSSEWKKQQYKEEWHPGENLSVAIGQGMVLATPLQMAVAYMGIGNGGEIIKPFVIKIVKDGDKIVLENKKTVVRQISDIAPEHFKTVQEGLYRVVNGPAGTARTQVRLEGVNISGKTGTAQVRAFSAKEIYAKCESRPVEQRHHGWFIGYAPSENPEIAVAVLAEHSCAGSRGAGPVARKIFLEYFKKYHPEWNVRVPGEKVSTPLPSSQTGIDE
jgi:penicillin-binding protein 2